MENGMALQNWMNAVDKHNQERHPERETARARDTQRMREAERFLAEQELSFKAQQRAVTTGGGTQQAPTKMSKYDYMMQLRGAPLRQTTQNERITLEEQERLQGRVRAQRTRSPNQNINVYS